MAKGSGLLKELCAFLIDSQLLIARPFMSGAKSLVNCLKVFRSSPKSTSGLFSKIDSRAWVAHALFTTCDAKKTFGLEWSTSRLSLWSWFHLNKKIKPYTGATLARVSLSSE